MSSKYAPPDKKVITPITIDTSVREWIEKNLPPRSRSDFFNSLAREYILREMELIKRGKLAKDAK